MSPGHRPENEHRVPSCVLLSGRHMEFLLGKLESRPVPDCLTACRLIRCNNSAAEDKSGYAILEIVFFGCMLEGEVGRGRKKSRYEIWLRLRTAAGQLRF